MPRLATISWLMWVSQRAIAFVVIVDRPMPTPNRYGIYFLMSDLGLMASWSQMNPTFNAELPPSRVNPNARLFEPMSLH